MMNNAQQDKETGRIEAFSDGVFAIVITLLAFELRPPSVESTNANGLATALLQQWPNYLAFAASFFFILVMWINHHRLFTVIRRSDNNLMLLNGLLLFGITLLPFPTLLVAEYLQHSEQVTAVFFYNGLFLMIAVFYNLLWMYAAGNNRLFNTTADKSLMQHIARQYSVGLVMYTISLLMVFVNPVLSLMLNGLLGVFFAVPNRSVQQLMNAPDSAVNAT